VVEGKDVGKVAKLKEVVDKGKAGSGEVVASASAVVSAVAEDEKEDEKVEREGEGEGE